MTNTTKPDSPKSATTKQYLVNAFLNLLRTRPLSEITVKDITADCGVNRNTFYYHFKNLPDLIEYSVKTTVDDIIIKHPPKIGSIEECFIAAINFASENSQSINHIYHSANRTIFERHLWHLCDYTISAYLSSIPTELHPYSTPDEQTVVKDFLKFELFGFTIDWINRGMPPGIEQKIATITHIFRHMPKNVY